MPFVRRSFDNSKQPTALKNIQKATFAKLIEEAEIFFSFLGAPKKRYSKRRFWCFFVWRTDEGKVKRVSIKILIFKINKKLILKKLENIFWDHLNFCKNTRSLK